MAITLVASVSLLPPGNSGGTSAAIDTTGADLLVLRVAHYATVTVSDNKGNSWVPLTAQISSSTVQQFYCCFGGTVGTGHTFTMAGGGLYGAATVHAFAGVAAFHAESGATTSTTQPIASGSVTPPTDGALILTSMGSNNAGTDTVAPSGFTVLTTPYQFGLTLQVSTGYLIQTTAAAINPSWTWTGGHDSVGVTTAVFVPVGPPPALTRVQATPVAVVSGTTASVTFTTPPAVGHGIVVAVLAQSNTASLTCTDTPGNSYSHVLSRTDGSAVWGGVFYCAAVATSGTPFTVTVGTVSTGWTVVAIEVNGALAVDQSSSGNSSGGVATTGATAASTGVESFQVAATVTASSFITMQMPFPPAWTQEVEHLSFGAYGEVDSRIVPAAVGTTPSAAWSLNGANFWGALLVAFTGTAAPTAVERVQSYVVMPV